MLFVLCCEQTVNRQGSGARVDRCLPAIVYLAPLVLFLLLPFAWLQAGFLWRQPGCSMCLAMNADKLGEGERCASTSNRNFVSQSLQEIISQHRTTCLRNLSG